jgi:hypothetical protein
MTVAADRTITNSSDTERKYPSTTLSPRVLTSLEGSVQESIAGPDAVGAAPANVVTLSRPARAIQSIQSYVTATGVAGAVLFPLSGTHWNAVLSNAAGVAQLTNPSIVDFSAETWVVTYQPDDAEETVGGQTTVTP